MRSVINYIEIINKYSFELKIKMTFSEIYKCKTYFFNHAHDL